VGTAQHHDTQEADQRHEARLHVSVIGIGIGIVV
jgi:hypothetical protein